MGYLGLNPHEKSSGGQQHMGPISKQGNSMMRWLLVEAGQAAARLDPELRRVYQRLKFRRGSSVACQVSGGCLGLTPTPWTLPIAFVGTKVHCSRVQCAAVLEVARVEPI